MTWRAISELTEEAFDEAYLDHRLVVWNDCNGPHLPTAGRDCYMSLSELLVDDVWTKYFILPEAK